ncbi:MAG: CNP1-like family protein [Polaromonas sp.]
MKFKSASRIACGLLLSLSSMVWAQFLPEDPEWKESDVPPPPAFDIGKLVTFEVSPNSSLVFGIDPASISLSKSDGLVRYVMVATSASGARNVMYEAIRCSTGEFKTYARYSPEGRWDMASNPVWRSMFGNMPSKHALYFAKAGACDNASSASSVNELVRRLKKPGY